MNAVGKPVESDSQPIRAVVFDLFHTLVDVNEAPGLGAAQILGIDPLVWNQAVIEEARHHALGEVADAYESLRRIAHAIDASIPAETVRRAVEARPQRFRHALVHVRPEILDGVRAIRALGVRLALLSNAAHDEIFAWSESPLAPYFDAALFSCREKRMKPDPEYYHLAADRLEVAPAECLFVGDGGSREHEGARLAGMRSVLILGLLERSLPAIAARRPRNATWTVQSIEEVVKIVRSLAPSSASASEPPS